MILEKNSFSCCVKYIKKIDITKIYLLCLLCLLYIQHIVYNKYSRVKPQLEIVPASFSKKTMKAFMFGDEEFYFRIKGLKVQNMGDTYARFSPLKDYDYKKLYDWFNNLDELDKKSNYLVAMSAYYFSQTQNVSDRIYPILFLEKYAKRDLEHKWWWMYQAMFLSKFSLKDRDLTVRLTKYLTEHMPSTAPMWLKQLSSLYLFDAGEDCESIRVFFGILDEYNKILAEKRQFTKREQEQLNFMSFFIKKMNEDIKTKHIDIEKCRLNYSNYQQQKEKL